MATWMPVAAACAAKLCEATSWTPCPYWQGEPRGGGWVMTVAALAADARQPPVKALSCAPEEPVRAGRELTMALMASSYGTPPQPPATVSFVVAVLKALRSGEKFSMTSMLLSGIPTRENWKSPPEA